MIEYNGHLLPEQSLTVPEMHRATRDGTVYYGASLIAYERLARSKGYRLVHTELNGKSASSSATTSAPPCPTATWSLAG